MSEEKGSSTVILNGARWVEQTKESDPMFSGIPLVEVAKAFMGCCTDTKNAEFADSPRLAHMVRIMDEAVEDCLFKLKYQAEEKDIITMRYDIKNLLEKTKDPDRDLAWNVKAVIIAFKIYERERDNE